MYHVPHPYMSCAEEDCQLCWDHENDINYCDLCGQNTLKVCTIHCPKFYITIDKLVLIEIDKLQFYKGKWWTANES